MTYNVRVTINLDAPDTYTRLDPEGLLGRISALPDQIDEAWAAASAFDLPKSYADVDRIVVLGMGGSGIGGALLRSLAIDLGAKTPVEIVRGYTLPAHVDDRSLVFASSNSGNTEEIVAAYRAAIAAGAKCVAITTGGALRNIAATSDLPALRFTWDGEPRAALGWSFASLLAICGRLGVLPDVSSDLRVALTEMRRLGGTIAFDVPEAKNPAKQMARRLSGKLPVIIGAEALTPVAYRWRTQMNENAKSWALAEELPEMNHNAPLGYGAPADLVPLLHLIVLRHASMHPRIRLRVDATLTQLRDAGVAAEVVDVPGATTLSQMLSAIHLGDFVSYYAGILNGVNPSSMAALDWLKATLASHE